MNAFTFPDAFDQFGWAAIGNSFTSSILEMSERIAGKQAEYHLPEEAL